MHHVQISRAMRKRMAMAQLRRHLKKTFAVQFERFIKPFILVPLESHQCLGQMPLGNVPAKRAHT